MGEDLRKKGGMEEGGRGRREKIGRKEEKGGDGERNKGGREGRRREAGMKEGGRD